MAKTVKIKVRDTGKVVPMNEDAAKRLLQTHTNGEYSLVEDPKVEVLLLPPISVDTQKKSVVVAEVESKSNKPK